MTIGFVLDDTLDVADGVQQNIITIGNKLRSLGHEIHYIVPTTLRTDIPNIHVVGKSLAMKFNGNSVRTPLPSSAKLIKKLFSEVKFDALHVQMPFSPMLGGKVIRCAPKNVVIVGTFHILPYNKIATYGTRILGALLRKSLKRLDACFAVSKPALEFMKNNFKVDGQVLPNPIDYNFFASAKKDRPDDSKTRIVFVGRFDERKGVVALVNAYASLDKKVRGNSKLTMCGKGPLLGQCQSMSNKLDLKIDFPGFITEERKAQELANADIAMFPSISGESFGIVLVEAMAAHSGVVLGGNNPGYASVLAPWPDVLFDPKNTDRFKSVLEKFINDKSLRKAIGDDQHLQSKQYDIELVVNKLLATYTN